MVLPAMAGLLLVYIALHSPLLGLVGRMLGRQSSRCYFTCSGWAANGRPLDAAAALLCVLLAVSAAWLVASRVPLRGAERMLAFGLLTMLFIVLPASLLGFVGWATGATPLRPPLGPLLTGLPAALTILGGAFRGWWPRDVWPAWERPSPLAVVLGSTAFALLATSVAVSLFHPPTGYDALSYHAPLAVYFWRDGNLGIVLDQQRWGWALAHPGTMELWAGLLRLGGGEGAADLAQLPFALLGAVAVYVFSRRTGLRQGAAAIGALAFLISPLVVMQAGMQLNDLTAGALLMAAAALIAAPPRQWSAIRMTLVGVGLGLAITTKLALLPAAAVVAVYPVLVARRAGGWRPLAAAAAGFAVVVAPWWLRNLAMYGNPIYPAALPFLGRGIFPSQFGPADTRFVPGAAAWPLYPLLESHGEMSGMGALFAVAAVPGILVALGRGRRTPAVLLGLLSGVSLPAWWIFTRHEPRFLLHLFGLGFAFLGWSLVAVPRKRRPLAAGLIGAAAVFSAMVTADQALRPLGRAPTGRFEFYDHVWGVDSVASALPPLEALLSHTGYARLSYAADYALLGPGVGRTLVTIDGRLPTDSIIGIMQPRGIRYAYVPAAAESQEQISAMYPSDRFDLIHSSIVNEPGRTGIRRYLFHLREPVGHSPATSVQP
jgi:hypothetical protein